MTTALTQDARIAPDENALIAAMIARQPDHIVIVSDLHLGVGRDAVTGRWAGQENFTADFAFARCLEKLRALQGHVLLVLNGDTFDFLRLDKIPEDSELNDWRTELESLGRRHTVADLKASIGSVERTFGLRTNDFKSVWKLDRIRRGHPQFFDALAAWVNAGRDLLIVTGNHDVELYWQLVRDAFRFELAQRGVDLKNRGGQIAFCERWTQFANVYIEHGHQYEPLTRVEGPDTLPNDPTQLNLPLGSFVNRYLINPLERLDPFLDNVKPVNRALRELLRRHPIKSLAILQHALRFIRRAVEARRFRDGLGFLFYFGSILAPFIGVGIIAVSLIATSRGRQVTGHPRLEIATGVLGLFAPYLFGALGDFRDWLGSLRRRKEIGEDGVAQGLAKALPGRIGAASYAVVYAVLGHTHQQDVQDISTRERRILYVNTGTWIALWPLDRPDLAGKVLYPLVHFSRSNGAYELTYTQWNDAGRCLEEASIIHAG